MNVRPPDKLIEATHERTTITTKNGRPAVVIIAAGCPEILEATLAIISDPELSVRFGTGRRAGRADQ